MVKGDHPGTAFAKTTRPAIGSVVERETLFARLDEPPGRTVVWISGPPGAGKTTLAASYVQVRRLDRCGTRSTPTTRIPPPSSITSPMRCASWAARARVSCRRSRRSRATTSRRSRASFSGNFSQAATSRSRWSSTICTPSPPRAGSMSALEAGFSQVPKGCRSSSPAAANRRPPSRGCARAARWPAWPARICALSPDEIVLLARVRGQVVSPEVCREAPRAHAGLGRRSRADARAFEVLGANRGGARGRTPQVIFDYLAGEIFDRFEARHARVPAADRLPAADDRARWRQALAGEPKAEQLLSISRSTTISCATHRPTPAASTSSIRCCASSCASALRRLAGSDEHAWLQRAARLLHDADQTEDAVALLVEAGAGRRSRAIVRRGERQRFSRRAAATRWPHGSTCCRPRSSTRARALLRFGRCTRAREPARGPADFRARARGVSRTTRRGRHARSCRGIVDAIVYEFDDVAPLDRWLDVLDDLLAQNARRGCATRPRCRNARRYIASRRWQSRIAKGARDRVSGHSPPRRASAGRVSRAVRLPRWRAATLRRADQHSTVFAEHAPVRGDARVCRRRCALHLVAGAWDDAAARRKTRWNAAALGGPPRQRCVSADDRGSGEPRRR